MPSFTDIIGWLQSGDGRLVAAGVLFFLMWGIKSIPLVKEKLLTTPRRKQLAVAFLALAPAVAMLTGDAPVLEVAVTALTLFFSAMGLNTLRPSKSSPDPLPGPEKGDESEGDSEDGGG